MLIFGKVEIFTVKFWHPWKSEFMELTFRMFRGDKFIFFKFWQFLNKKSNVWRFLESTPSKITLSKDEHPENVESMLVTSDISKLVKLICLSCDISSNNFSKDLTFIKKLIDIVISPV